MCVIMVCDKVHPTEDMIRRAWHDNSDGGGVAWREEGNVHWKKGLTLNEMVELIPTLPFPHIDHFRKNSVGGVRASLTHPFPVHKNGTNFLNGKTNGTVLFHNGHWSDWKKTLFETVVKFGLEIPMGKWSDTRAMAFLTAVYGPGFLDLMDEKTVLFGPKTLETCLPHQWKEVNGVLCSNDMFMPFKYANEKCRVQSCNMMTGLVDGLCSTHRVNITRGRTEQNFPPRGSQAPTRTSGTQAGETKTDWSISRNDAHKAGEEKGEHRGPHAVIPFASLRVAEDMFKENRKVSKKFINRVRFQYQGMVNKVTLTPQQRQILAQTSPTILIRGL